VEKLTTPTFEREDQKALAGCERWNDPTKDTCAHHGLARVMALTEESWQISIFCYY
jgi:hypothetical protein